MRGFILRRLLMLIPLLLGITFLVFSLMSLAPGDFLTPIKAQRDVSSEYIVQLEKRFGLDQPWYIQYFLWLKNILTLDFGYSWTYKIPVIELIGQRFLATVLLSFSAMCLAWSIAIPIGMIAAVRKHGLFDRLSGLCAYAALSIPEFFLALIAVFFAVRTGWFPIDGFRSVNYDFLPLGLRFLDIVHHLVLPTLVLGIGSIAGIMRIHRTNVLDTLNAEYITTAQAKGLPERTILTRHVLRNAINPLISTLGLSLSSLLSGSLIIETIFNYPGLGQLIYHALLREDTFVVMGATVMSCVLLVIGNLIADILLAISDPRVRTPA